MYTFTAICGEGVENIFLIDLFRDFLFFSVKIERKNIEKCRIILFWTRKNIFCCPVVSAGVGSIYTNGNSSTMHQKGTGQVMIWFWINLTTTYYIGFAYVCQ